MKLLIPADVAVPKANQCMETESGQRKNICTVEINGIGHLPRDLIVEILSRVPIKNLCKFRCVSKQWLNLLSLDTHFISHHWKQSKKTPFLIFQKYCSSGLKQDQEGNKHHKVTVELTSIGLQGTFVQKISAFISGPVHVFASSGPLVILCCAFRIYVSNQSTREFVRVPRPTGTRYYTIGFGYLPSSEEYKIVHLFRQEPFVGDKEMGCEIFTIRHGEGVKFGSWRRIEDCPYKVLTDGSPVCVCGVIYWKVSEENVESNNKSILSFDLGKEEFRLISYPKSYSDWECKLVFLTGLKGDMCLVDCSAKTSVMDVWRLKDLKNSIWVKKISISLSPLGAEIEVRGIVPCDDEDGDLLIKTEKKGLVHYNISAKNFRGIQSSGIVEWYKKPCLYYDGFFSLHRL